MSDSVTPWTAARQAPLSVGFSRQDYWSGLPFPSPGDLSDPGTEPCLLHFLHQQADSLPLVPPGEPQVGRAGGLNQEFLVLTLLCDFGPDPALLWASPSVKRESWSQTSLRRPSLKILQWQRRRPVAGTRSAQSWFSSRIRDCALQDAAATLLPRHSRFRECGPGEGCHLGSAASTTGSASRSLIRCYPPSAVSMSPCLCHSSGTPGLGANCLFMRPSVSR